MPLGMGDSLPVRLCSLRILSFLFWHLGLFYLPALCPEDSLCIQFFPSRTSVFPRQFLSPLCCMPETMGAVVLTPITHTFPVLVGCLCIVGHVVPGSGLRMKTVSSITPSTYQQCLQHYVLRVPDAVPSLQEPVPSACVLLCTPMPEGGKKETVAEK